MNFLLIIITKTQNTNTKHKAEHCILKIHCKNWGVGIWTILILVYYTSVRIFNHPHSERTWLWVHLLSATVAVNNSSYLSLHSTTLAARRQTHPSRSYYYQCWPWRFGEVNDIRWPQIQKHFGSLAPDWQDPLPSSGLRVPAVSVWPVG